jgi:hypothetical protein
MKRHLEPLAIVANIIQAAFCRLDDVLMAFGYLVMIYREMKDAEDLDGCRAIIESIERRWKKADQDVFIAAVILNPFYCTAPFAPLDFLNNAGIHALLNRLWVRFYGQGNNGQQPPPDFHTHITEYLNSSGYFKNLKSQCQIIDVSAQREVGPQFIF